MGHERRQAGGPADDDLGGRITAQQRSGSTSTRSNHTHPLHLLVGHTSTTAPLHIASLCSPPAAARDVSLLLPPRPRVPSLSLLPHPLPRSRQWPRHQAPDGLEQLVSSSTNSPHLLAPHNTAMQRFASPSSPLLSSPAAAASLPAVADRNKFGQCPPTTLFLTLSSPSLVTSLRSHPWLPPSVVPFFSLCCDFFPLQPVV